MCNTSLSRRLLLKGAIASGLVTATGCTFNETTGRSHLDLISDGQLEVAASRAWGQILTQEPRSANQVLTAQVQRVGQRIAAASGINAQWEFVLFSNDQPNAFVLPGGRVGIYEGLFKAARDDAQLAAVIGHEVGHVQARHAAERYSQSMAISLGVDIVDAVVTNRTGDAGAGGAAGDIFGVGATLGVALPYSRSHETEADLLGITNMNRAGYDPNTAIQLWENMMALGSGGVPEFLSTHPDPRNRISAMRQAIAAL